MRLALVGVNHVGVLQNHIDRRVEVQPVDRSPGGGVVVLGDTVDVVVPVIVRLRRRPLVEHMAQVLL